MKEGDVVQLRSGSADMTVQSIDDQRRVTCVWWNEKGVPQSDVFPEGILKVVPEGGDPFIFA